MLLACACIAQADAAEPLRVAVISDMNGSYGSVGYTRHARGAVAAILELRPDLVISTGDMVAGQRPKLLPTERLERMWAAFHADFSRPLATANIPFALTPGNHDASAYPDFIGERAEFARQWPVGSAKLDFVDRGNYPFYYAFTVQDALFVALDVTTTAPMPDAEFQWLAGVLAAASHYRHVVVFGHVPTWPVAVGRADEATGDRRLHELLARSGVDVFLSGHHHAFYPGVMDGVLYVSQACLGSGPRALLGQPAGERAPRGLTWIELGDDRIALMNLVAPGYELGEPWSGLPDSITVGGAKLVRADRADAPVAELESAASGQGH